jgi:hypothetical protein
MRSIEVMSGMVAFQPLCINPYLGQPTGTGTLLRGVNRWLA